MISEPSHILIVDDDRNSRETLADLMSVDGYHIEQASSGIDALEQLESAQPDVILLDVMMPQLDGFETCRRIKQNEAWRHIPIILVTALDDRDSIITGLDAGADEFLTKPMNGPVLRARVRSMLRIKRQYDELEAAVELRDALSNIMIHDMRNPLAIAMLKCNVMLFRGNLVDADEAAVRMIHTQIRRLDAFIDDILMTTRLGNGVLRVNRGTVRLRELLGEILHDFQELADTTQLTFSVEIPNSLEAENVDTALTARAVDNLLAQAFKHAPPGSTVTLKAEAVTSAETLPPRLRITVSDEGPGIPSDAPHERFDTAEIVALKQQGITQVSLGLAFCRQVAEAHGGQLRYRPNTPTGSIFTLEL